ncbi:hypothetical protein O6027_19880 [Sphingomonas aerolata]|uniref:hypothetical protein n=1 Tax=Sphingomonas aerolata TaxID=185951 RepID=UPI00334AC16A
MALPGRPTTGKVAGKPNRMLRQQHFERGIPFEQRGAQPYMMIKLCRRRVVLANAK